MASCSRLPTRLLQLRACAWMRFCIVHMYVHAGIGKALPSPLVYPCREALVTTRSEGTVSLSAGTRSGLMTLRALLLGWFELCSLFLKCPQ